MHPSQRSFDGLPTHPAVAFTPSDPLAAGSTWGRWLVQVGLPPSFGAWMLVEWLKYPDASILFGPFHWLMYQPSSAVQNGGLLACAVLVPCLLAFPVKPSKRTLCISGAAGMIWALMGSVGVFLTLLLVSASC